MSVCRRLPLPHTCRSGPSPCLISAIFFATSPLKNTDGCHLEDVKVFEATYLVAVLTLGQMSPCCGQNDAQISKVLRPRSKSIGRSNIFFTAAPMSSSSEYGAHHPPYEKPLLGSSSGPPPPCMTPSRVMCSSTVILLMALVPSN